MKTLSLDMSTTCVGISIWEDDKLIKAFKIKADKNLGWEERVRSFRKPLELIITKHNIDFILCEAVPLVSKGRIDMTAQAKATFVKLGAMRGMVISLADIHNIEFQAISPNTWRKNIGILQGKKDRATKKVMAIRLVNELFDLKLKCEFTKNGKYSETKSDDDIADSILLYCSIREEYRQKVG